ncbi:MAG: type III pantothenate kinase [Cyclobacteriaceae bacterium]|nr:type III pantothenate kinase [Cyclobacteriaceae bacterium]
MNLAVDYGNTRIKIGLFNEHALEFHSSFDHLEDFLDWSKKKQFDNAIISSVNQPIDNVLESLPITGKKLVMSQSIPLPVQIKYQTPHTLGVDRIAAACGAIELLPKRNCLVIDMGTCINYEFVDDQCNYFGGAISPGVSMRFKAMHKFTAKLPLVNPSENIELIGTNTTESLQSGVMIGVLSELEGVIKRYHEKYPNLGVILCGGDAYLFENKLKQPIFVAPNLVLRGLNRILVHNVGL